MDKKKNVKIEKVMEVVDKMLDVVNKHNGTMLVIYGNDKNKEGFVSFTGDGRSVAEGIYNALAGALSDEASDSERTIYNGIMNGIAKLVREHSDASVEFTTHLRDIFDSAIVDETKRSNKVRKQNKQVAKKHLNEYRNEMPKSFEELHEECQGCDEFVSCLAETLINAVRRARKTKKARRPRKDNNENNKPAN